MGKRRNKKQGNRQNTGNKAVEERKPAEKTESYVEEADVQAEAPYAEEADAQAQAPYAEEADERMEASYTDAAHDQGFEAYTEDEGGDQEYSDVPIDSLLEDVTLSETEKEASLGRQRHDMSNDFTDFTMDFFSQIGKWIKRNRRMAVVSLAVCAGVVVLIWIVASVSRSIDEARLAASVSGNPGSLLQGDQSGNTGMIPVPQEALQLNAYPTVNELVMRYFEAVQSNDIETLRMLKNYLDDVETAKINVKYRYVESYENIACYTKVGPISDSYIVYVCYDVKMRNWDVVAPSLLTLFVCTNPEGDLYIYVGELDENIGEYIAAISSQDDVKDLCQRVQTKYREVMDANPEFAAYMTTSIEIMKNEVGELLADAGYLDDDTENTPEVEPEEGADVSGNDAGEEGTTDFEVQAVTTVNVRASDSEVADRLGKVEAGTTLLCQEHQINGWSRVIYEGQVGYIKTEYLHTVGEGVDETAANGTITVSETVNVRKTANIEGEQIGVAYAGESFPLIGSTDAEWTQIIYNGQTGFVKSEFILER